MECLKLPNWKYWQLKCKVQGVCFICAQPAVNKTHCEKHRVMQNKIYKRWRDRVKQLEKIKTH